MTIDETIHYKDTAKIEIYFRWRKENMKLAGTAKSITEILDVLRDYQDSKEKEGK